MEFKRRINCSAGKLVLILALNVFTIGIAHVFAQQPMIGEQNGETWRSLVIGTEAETVTRKTFYIDGLYDMSVFWSRHAELKNGTINFNDAFIGLNVGQIRDGLDSFYVDDKNLQVPIIDAVLIVKLQSAQISSGKVIDIVKQFREATVNGSDAVRENKIWRAALKLLK